MDYEWCVYFVLIGSFIGEDEAHELLEINQLGLLETYVFKVVEYESRYVEIYK